MNFKEKNVFFIEFQVCFSIKKISNVRQLIFSFNISQAFPDITTETCLCGVHPFIGGQQMALAGEYLTLLTKIDASQKYVLD